jgi:propionyl-CoA carboxylase alpha chain
VVGFGLIKRMFKKLLIANRGEIACRVARTAHRMGIKTVGIYSDADQYSLHAQSVDQAFLVGPPPASESYL